MSMSTWLCTKSTKNMLVKIVHPGGHVELHDSPLLAVEIMRRNPRCCVAHPHIFQQPWAIVEPDTMLSLGQKYYVVPVSTIRKLQRLSVKYSPTSIHDTQRNVTPPPSKEDEKRDDMLSNYCNWFYARNKKSTKFSYACVCNHEENNVKEGGCFSEDNCFACFFKGTKIKENGGDHGSKEETESLSSSISSSEIETKTLTRKRNRNSTKHWGKDSTPKRLSSLDHWRPSLESIHEE